MMEVGHLPEPELEFHGGVRHVDIRFGLMENGPFDARPGPERRRIAVGIVGDAKTVEGTARWIEACRSGLPAKKSRQPNLFPGFPGLGPDGPFRCDFLAQAEHQAVIPPREVQRLAAIADDARAIDEIVEAFLARIRGLTDRNAPPDVVLCAVPLELIARAVNATESAEDGEDDAGEGNLRGQLKAACMELGVPIQMLWPTTYDAAIRIPRKLKITSERRVQDDATRAWNLFTALYYKANGLPWRLVRDPSQLRASFVGISFYRSRDGTRLYTSTAQMFDERGEGLILRGGRAVESKDDRRPHLPAQDAFELLDNSLRIYREQHGHFPARVVLHKTSNFNDDEQDGFARALDANRVDAADMITVSRTTTRLLRKGTYPPLRGSYARLDDERLVLYAKGSVDFFRTYPGMYVPLPLLLRFREVSQPQTFLAEEVLALSKMNWNNTQFDGGTPITVAAARKVGDILKFVPEGRRIAPRYSFYM